MKKLLVLLGLMLGISMWAQGGVVLRGENSKTAEAPRLVMQTGHGAVVRSVAFSPDGNTLVSGGANGTIKLWDVATGRELSTFVGHTNRINCVAFSPDGKTVVSGSGGIYSSHDNTVKLWNVATGRELRTLVGHREPVNSVAFSPDGKSIVSASGGLLTGGEDKSIKLWDVATGRELYSLGGHLDDVRSVAFSPDGKNLASGSHDHTLKLWKVATGKELLTIAGHGSSVWSVAFSPDGRTLVSGSTDKSLKLWDVATGQMLRTFAGHASSVLGVAFSPDGGTLVSASMDKTLKIWDVATGMELRSFVGHGLSVESVAFSPDGKTLVSGSEDKAIKLWDAATGLELRNFAGHGVSVYSVAFSPNGKTVVSGNNDETLKIWNLSSGQEPRTLSGHTKGVTSIDFSPEGKTIASGSGDKTIKLWDIVSGKELLTLGGHVGNISSVAFSPDGKTVVSGSFDNTLKLWNVFNGRELSTLDGHSTGVVASVAFSPDGKTVVSGEGKVVKIWDKLTGKELRSLVEHSDSVTSVAFSPDGITIVSGSWDQTLRLWDVASGRELRAMVEHGGAVKSVAFSPDGKTVVSGSMDKSIKLWRISDGLLLATLTTFDDGHWAVTDPEGRFDASNGGDNPHLHWVFENTPIDLSQLKDRYYDPGLLQKIMGNSTEPLRTVPKFEDAVLRRWPEVEVSTDAQNPLRLNINLTDRGDGYGRVRVRLNGKELTANATAGKSLSGKTASLTLDLDPSRLLPGDNRIDVVAWPSAGHIPSPASQLVVAGAAARGANRVASDKSTPTAPVTLHAVVMGVSQYAGANLRLAFSGKDAVDFANTVEMGGARLFGAERVRMHRFSDFSTTASGSATSLPTTSIPTDQLPSRDNLKRAFDTIAKEAKVGDILLVYLAGHGVMTPGAAGEAEYYYLSREAQSTDLSDPAVRKLWGISSSELTDWIKQIKASKQVLVLDTCAAGGAIDKLVAKRQIPGAQVIALEQLKDRTGVHILAGAAADKVSFEATQFGQGLLTYALLTGMKGAALKDEIIDVQKLFQYTRDEVPKLARQIGGIQEPRLSSPQGESFAIGRMAEDDRKRVPLAQIKPMIQRASFQDETRMMDVLKLGKRFDDRLKLETYAAARGSVVYVDADDYPDAWQVSGRYHKDSTGVKVMARLFQGDAEKASFEVLLPIDEAGQADALLNAVMKAMGRGL